MSLPVSADEIDAARTPNGGWTKAQFEAWGVGWPPPKGWRERLINGAPPVKPSADPILDLGQYPLEHRPDLDAVEVHVRDRVPPFNRDGTPTGHWPAGPVDSSTGAAVKVEAQPSDRFHALALADQLERAGMWRSDLGGNLNGRTAAQFIRRALGAI